MFRKKHAPVGAMPGIMMVSKEAPRPALKLVDYGPDRVEEREITDPAEVADYLETDSVTWVDVQGLGDEVTLIALGEIFKLHPLALADIVNIPQRPKVEDYPDHLFIIARIFALHAEKYLDPEQLSIFLGRNYVLTFQERPSDRLDPVKNRVRNGKGPIRQSGPDYLAYAILDSVIDYYFPILEQLGEHLEDLEEEVVGRPGPGTLRKIHRAKRELLTLRRAVWPQRESLNTFMRDESDLVGERVRVYLRDSYDHIVQMMDVVETYRELTAGLLDVYLSSLSNRMNDVMKVLTIIATIFIPITFIAGVYGMNFEFMPELKWRWGYPAIWMVMLGMGLSLLGLFRRLGWWGRQKTD